MSSRAALLPALALCLALLLSGCGGQAAPASGGDGAEAGSGSELTVYCFAAGKADAFLLYTASGAVLLDCGEKGFGKEILAYLEEAGIEHLDYLIVTHFDQDHVGGAAKVLNSIPVDNVLQSNTPKDSTEVEKYEKALDAAGLTPVTVRETLTFTLDGVAYTVDPPRQTDYASDDSNNSSLIVSVTNGEKRLLFMGDAMDERTAEYLSSDRGTYDFVKLPHHGRWQETLEELIASAKPAHALITSSDSQPEDAETLELLERAGAQVWLTRVSPVLLYSDGAQLSVSYAEKAQADAAA